MTNVDRFGKCKRRSDARHRTRFPEKMSLQNYALRFEICEPLVVQKPLPCLQHPDKPSYSGVFKVDLVFKEELNLLL